MTDPLDKATSTAPPTIGEGCLSRYDPAALTSENGADFDGAAQLWLTTQLDNAKDKESQTPDSDLVETH